MYGLTTLGAIHTAISLVALAAGFIAVARDREITGKNGTGRLYVITTVLTCLTGFGIYQHGGFGAPHALGIITLIVLGIAWKAERSMGKTARYVAVLSYSLTLFFHMIPTITETATRLPLDAPLVADREGPEIQAGVAVAFLLFLIGATFQIMAIRRQGAKPAPDLAPVIS